MKFTINRSKFKKFLDTFSTEGRRMRSVKKRRHMAFAHLELKPDDTELFVLGRNNSAKIFCRGTISVTENIEPGSTMIVDIKKFLDELKHIRGKELTFDIGLNKVDVTSTSGKKIGFPHKTTPKEAAKLELAEKWSEDHFFEEDTVKFRAKGKVYDYNHWFDLDESKPLNRIEKDTIDMARKNEFIMRTEANTIIVSANNETDKRSFETPIEARVVYVDNNFELGEIFPILSNLSGPVQVYSYVTKKGSIKLWFSTEDFDWLTIYYGG